MPLVNRTFDQLIDFTRTSAATFVNSSGNIASTPQSVNLLTFTQEFDNAAWTKTRASVTANSTTAPDGTSTADKVIANSDANYHAVQRSFTFSSGVAVFSIYAKAAEYSLFRMFDINNGDFAASFDLTNGTVSNTGGPRFLSASAVAVGNGWYRCTLTVVNVNAARSPGFIGYPAGATLDFYGANYTGDGTSGVFAWGAQIEAVPDANLVLGSELWANQTPSITDFGGTAGAYNTGTKTMTNGGSAFIDHPRFYFNVGMTVGKVYRVSGVLTGSLAQVTRVRLVQSGTANDVPYSSTTGVFFGYVTAAAVGLEIVTNLDGAESLTISSVSIREITGTTGMPSDYTRNFGGLFPPRFDYDPVSLAPRGLLIEEQRTNLLTYSEQFDNAAWTATGATVTANSVVSPDGTADADSLVEDTSAGVVHRVFATPACSASTTYTFTAYVKAAGRTEVRLLETTLGGAIFNLSTVAIVSTDAGVTASIQDAGNGWRRCRITATTGGAQTLYVAQIQGSVAGNPTYTGNGAVALYLWGAQLEAGAFATSYIPTVASQVTRSADVAVIQAPNFAPWYNQSEGTVVAEFDCSGSSSVLSADDTTNNNFIRVGRLNTTGRLRVFNGGVDQADVLPANAPGWAGVVKIAAAYKANDFAASASGGTASTDTSGAIPAVTQFRLGTSGGGDPINGHIRSIRYYPTRLSNAQLQALSA